jgi:hypothetical protein
MNNTFKIWLISFLMGLAFIGLVSATDDIFKVGDIIDYKKPCINNGTYCSGSAVCNLTVIYPNSSLLINNALMTNQVSYHNYTLSPQYTIGTYTANMICTDTGRSGSETLYFQITPTGFNGLVGFYFLALILSYGLVAFGIYRGDIIFTMLGSFGLFSMGLFILFNGLDTFKNNLTEAIALVTLGIAMYVSARTGIEMINQ